VDSGFNIKGKETCLKRATIKWPSQQQEERETKPLADPVIINGFLVTYSRNVRFGTVEAIVSLTFFSTV
jgi:hypothetical protein